MATELQNLSHSEIYEASRSSEVKTLFGKTGKLTRGLIPPGIGMGCVFFTFTPDEGGRWVFSPEQPFWSDGNNPLEEAAEYDMF